MISNHTQVEPEPMRQHAQIRDHPTHLHHQIVRIVPAIHRLRDKIVTAETRQGLRAMTGQAIHRLQGQAMNQEVMTDLVIHLLPEVMTAREAMTGQAIHLLQDPVLHPVAIAHLQAVAVAAALQGAVEEVPTNNPRPQEEEDNYKTYHFT